MKKIICTGIFTFVAVLCYSLVITNNTKFTVANALPQSNYAESEANSTIINLLNPYIDNAIKEYYRDTIILDYMGQPTATQTALYDAKVNQIVRIDDSFSFKVTVTVPTFHGAHNPPYGLEKMTFIIQPGGVTLINYEHIANNR